MVITRHRKAPRRTFGAIRQLPSGRYRVRYPNTADDTLRPAPDTFETKRDAEAFLVQIQAVQMRGDWLDPTAGDVLFADYATRWIAERGLAPTTAELYRRLFRLHLEPTFGEMHVNTKPRSGQSLESGAVVRHRRDDGGQGVPAAQSREETAVEDDMIRKNPCRIRGAGREDADERPVATVEQVFAAAEVIGLRWRLMVLLGAFASMRPEELAELRRRDVDLDSGALWVRRAAPELNTGHRVVGAPKSGAGRREIVLPSFLHEDVRRHLEWFAQPGPDGLVFVRERGAVLRGTTFGRKWRRDRDKVGLPEGFRFYDLRHTGNTLAADTGAKLKDLMVRVGQSPSARN